MLQNTATKAIRGIGCILQPISQVRWLTQSILNNHRQGQSKQPLPSAKHLYTCINQPTTTAKGHQLGLSQPRPLSLARRKCLTTSAFENFLFGDRSETIYALSTPSGRAAIAIIRISGPACGAIYRSLCPGMPDPKPRRATVRALSHPSDPNSLLDPQALVLSFLPPNTATGEMMLELHVHGGPAIIKSILAAIPQCKPPEGYKIRYAEPGEFTRRAFQNNRLDLTEVEALSEALSAETEQQRLAAMREHSSHLGELYEEWRHLLIEARGKLEAIIDFSETESFEEKDLDLINKIHQEVGNILWAIHASWVARQRAELIRKGIRISLLGPPNVGKSSLLNYIVGREASIVSQEAGTTRDIVEVSLDIRGYLCTFADTAGLRSTIKANVGPIRDDEIIGNVEQEGIRRAKLKASESDVIIALASVENDGGEWIIRYDPESLDMAARAKTALVVVNKMDLIKSETLLPLVVKFQKKISPHFSEKQPEVLTVSCNHAKSNSPGDLGGVEKMVNELAQLFKELTEIPPDSQDLSGATERQHQLLDSCSEYLEKYLAETDRNEMDLEFDIVLAAEWLREAAACLSKITGRGEASDVEEVLGVVFEKLIPNPPRLKQHENH